jgi:transcriptional regulator with XRE-family HTH domain
MSQQLAFGFDLEPEDPKRKRQKARRKRLIDLGVTGFQDVYTVLLENPPAWESRFWPDHPARRRNWWRKAAFIAWSAAPRDSRRPTTLGDLADLLGVSRKTIWGWRQANPEIDQAISRARIDALLAHLSDVDMVTIFQATDPEGTVAARRLYYDRVAEAQEQAGGAGGADDPDGLAHLTDDELIERIEDLEMAAA